MRRPQPQYVAIGLLVISLLTQLPANKVPERTATVHLKVVDPLGDDVRDPTVAQFKPQEPGRDLSSGFSHAVAVKVPFGTYDLKVHAVGFWSALRTVHVYSPEVWVVVELLPGQEGGPTLFTLKGTVSNVHERELWVRLVGLRSGMIFDGRVDAAGTFALAGIPSASYVLFVRNGNDVLLSRTVEITKDESLSLTPSGR